MTDTSKSGGGEVGCVIIIAIIALCVAVSWARKNPGTAAMVVCVIAAIGIAWYMWDRHNQSESKRRLFDTKFGKILEKYEKDFQVVEGNLEQTRKIADSADGTIAELERNLRTLS